MKVIKAGCILVDTKNKKIGLIYRSNRNDYSFPKGHKENGESLVEYCKRAYENDRRTCDNFYTLLVRRPYTYKNMKREE